MLLVIIALKQYATAQNVVNPNDFYENTAKYNGHTIIFKDIKVRKSVAKNVNIGSGVQVTPGSGSAPGSTSTEIKCTAPRDYEIFEVIFPNGKTKGCFVILSKVANPVPSDKDVIATITFKANSKTMNTITMIKFIP